MADAPSGGGASSLAGRAGRPDVSVVVPVWNVAAYLPECLDSVLHQSIGCDRLEIVAVDDGSTDGSGEIVDAYAADHPEVRVIHQANSGGPGAPRNVGIEHAQGRYVFFLDGDDYLGQEALERLVAMADRNRSDIVLARTVGIDGRRHDRREGPFRRDADRIPLELAYRTANVLKLFRRSLLERAGTRFRAGVAGGEDGDFMARIYPEAGTISVVADYDCYFVRRRPGSQTTRKDRRDDLVEYLQRLEAERMLPTLARRRPGPARDVLMARHLHKVARLFRGYWRSLEADERRRVFDVAASIVRRRLTPLIWWALPSWSAIRLHCLRHGLLRELEDVVATDPKVAYGRPILDGGRIYARLPHFRDGSGIPDRCFDITREVRVEQDVRTVVLAGARLRLAGTSYLRLLGGTTTIELRRWPGGRRVEAPTTAVATPDLRDGVTRYPEAGFDTTIDLRKAVGTPRVRPGIWAVNLVVRAAGVTRRAPLRVRPWAGSRRTPPGRPAASSAARGRTDYRAYLTRSRELRLLAGTPRRAARLLERYESIVIGVLAAALRRSVATRAGPYTVIALERLWPELAARLLESRGPDQPSSMELSARWASTQRGT